MRKKGFLIALCLVFSAICVKAQDNVNNIKMWQNDKEVVVTYDLKRRAIVKMYISLDDGKNYTDTMSVSGYINKVVSPGKSRVVRWNAFQNLGYGDYPEIRFKFVAEEKPLEANNKKGKTYNFGKKDAKRFFFTVNGSMTTRSYPAVGVTVGQYEKFGWFASLMSGFNFAGLFPADVCDENGFVGDNLPFYKDEYAKTTLSVMGGGIFKISKSVHVMVGAGFGNRSLSWKTLDDKWVRNKAYSAIGIDLSAGLLFNIGDFVLTIDAVTTNFKTLEGKIGLGYSFITK